MATIENLLSVKKINRHYFALMGPFLMTWLTIFWSSYESFGTIALIGGGLSWLFRAKGYFVALFLVLLATTFAYIQGNNHFTHHSLFFLTSMIGFWAIVLSREEWDQEKVSNSDSDSPRDKENVLIQKLQEEISLQKEKEALFLKENFSLCDKIASLEKAEVKSALELTRARDVFDEIQQKLMVNEALNVEQEKRVQELEGEEITQSSLISGLQQSEKNYQLQNRELQHEIQKLKEELTKISLYSNEAKDLHLKSEKMAREFEEEILKSSQVNSNLLAIEKELQFQNKVLKDEMEKNRVFSDAKTQKIEEELALKSKFLCELTIKLEDVGKAKTLLEEAHSSKDERFSEIQEKAQREHETFAKYLQLQHQFKEKSEQLDQARFHLFHTEEKLNAYLHEREEGHLEEGLSSIKGLSDTLEQAQIEIENLEEKLQKEREHHLECIEAFFKYE